MPTLQTAQHRRLATSQFLLGKQLRVVAIKADGHCCYHLGGMFQLLCRNPNALSQGFARCLPKDTQAAREQILQNFRSWRLNRPEYLTHEEWATQVLEMTGDSLENFERRAAGKAVGDAKLGSYIDLAILTRHEDIRVATITTDKDLSPFLS